MRLFLLSFLFIFATGFTYPTACFPPRDKCDAVLTQFMDTAQHSLDIAIFDINLTTVVDHIIMAKNRGVKVRMVVDERQSKSPYSLVKVLLQNGIDVRIGKQRGIMHNKFTIVDNHNLELGSFNYTNGAAFKNNENQLYISGQTDLELNNTVMMYSTRFEQIWNEAKVATK